MTTDSHASTEMRVFGRLGRLLPECAKDILRALYYRMTPERQAATLVPLQRLDREGLIDTLVRVDRLDPSLARATHVIVMSEILKEAVMRMGVAENRITVLGNRVDTSLFRPRDDPGARRPKDQIHLLFVGRQKPQKNLHGVMESVKRLASLGYKPVLNICGGGRREPFTTLCMFTKGVQRYCRFLGAFTNSRLPQLYNQVDMLVNPSFFEGFQIPLIEALACGVPAVTSDQEPTNRIISECTGALVNPEDPEDIVRGILSVKKRLDDPGARQRLKVNCRIEAVTKWDYCLVSQKEVEVYEAALAAGRAGAPREAAVRSSLARATEV